MSRNVHVIPSDGGWKVRVEGGHDSKQFKTQREAMTLGRSIARSNRSDQIIHGRDGRIRQRDSYGRDPFPAKG